MKATRKLPALAGLTAGLLLLAALSGWYWWGHREMHFPPGTFPPDFHISAADFKRQMAAAKAQREADAKLTPQERLIKYSGVKRFADLTEADRVDLTNRFNARMKPAIEKFCKAYEGHLFFRPEDVTLDKFHNRMADVDFTFMLDTNTVVIVDNPNVTRISYLAHKGALLLLNGAPSGDGKMPDMSVPVQRDEIIRMIKAESGEEYQPDQVQIRPTAGFSPIQGGASVEVGAKYINGGLSLADKSYEMTFSQTGTLVYYDVGPLLYTVPKNGNQSR